MKIYSPVKLAVSFMNWKSRVQISICSYLFSFVKIILQQSWHNHCTIAVIKDLDIMLSDFFYIIDLNPGKMIIKRGYMLLSRFYNFLTRSSFLNNDNLVNMLVFSNVNHDRILSTRGYMFLSRFCDFLDGFWW